VRADSAAHQAAIFNYCEEIGEVFTIGADQDAAVKAAIGKSSATGRSPRQFIA
jgi:hypothetical protein